ncbi:MULTISPECIES: DinI family protein [unclassified Symbiopectobacterium]|uniref:DinI family protein n=1 Tax=unclassified Symbiopectobacterium TaxID=2794573 RepID=UPI0022266BFE|nr:MULTISPECIES: DinI family protein [unclassified Symbiopectobacterium]MCW2475727.1 DinI family protein [Candidatus Symbiopectobacterium sp. NZEC151]MCW2486090.1 DinI family protein [Candidatus Symbiopectobacterium sp. NZEC127]
MFVELVYDKRNVAGLNNAHTLIEKELIKRVHRAFPDAEVRAKAMQANAINSDASKSDKAVINRLIEEMFNDADEWLVAD